MLLLSLFGSGLKTSVGLRDGRWLLPLRLAIVSMIVTIALIAGAGVAWLGLPLGAAILLGGILAPTDPCWRRTCKSPSRPIAIGCASR